MIQCAIENGAHGVPLSIAGRHETDRWTGRRRRGRREHLLHGGHSRLLLHLRNNPKGGGPRSKTIHVRDRLDIKYATLPILARLSIDDCSAESCRISFQHFSQEGDLSPFRTISLSTRPPFLKTRLRRIVPLETCLSRDSSI